jgi:hypothetical protein
MREQVNVPCPSCGGEGFETEEVPGSYDYESWPCAECDGAREVKAFCRKCDAPAFALVGVFEEPQCDGCRAICTLCELVTPEDDRLPWGQYGAFAHTECALRFQRALIPQNLEVAYSAEENFPTVSERASARTLARRLHDIGDVIEMPKPSPRLIEVWRAKGFIPSSEAVERSGHSLTTIYEWIELRLLKAERSGIFHFVEEKSLEECCPQTRRAAS